MAPCISFRVILLLCLVGACASTHQIHDTPIDQNESESTAATPFDLPSDIQPNVSAPSLQEDSTTPQGDSNDTSNVPSHRWPCKRFNLTDENSATYLVPNDTVYTEILARMNTTHGCGLLLFYSPYCEFCTNFAPLYNAIGRSYPDLAVMAFDAHESIALAARYGVVGIPSVFFFYSGRPVAKFNQSREAPLFEKFVKELSGFTPTVPLNVTDIDMEGPIGTKVIESRDYYLVFSICFLAFFLGSKLFGNYLLDFALYVFESLKRRVVDWFNRKSEPAVVKEKED